MKNLIRKILFEEILKDKVVCDSCGWSWKLSEGGKDKYVCHKCGNDNSPKKSNLDIVIDRLSEPLDYEGFDYEIDYIKKYLKNYISQTGFNLKYLESCKTSYRGVRTRNEVIICSPDEMSTLGDFLYVIFHEIRHDQQIRNYKMPDPLADMDLNDFEKVYDQYWEMELDADQFAKNKVATLVKKLDLPMKIAVPVFRLSPFIEKYPTQGKAIESNIRSVILGIKQMQMSGETYRGIHDHPLVKPYLEKLQNLL